MKLTDGKEEQGKAFARNGGLQSNEGWRNCQSQKGRGRADETSEAGGLAASQEEGENWKYNQGSL